jgi:hypothetical protein
MSSLNLQFYYHLQIIIGTAIIQRYKLVIAKGSHPSHDNYFLAGRFLCQQFFYLYPLVEHFEILRVAKVSFVRELNDERNPGSHRGKRCNISPTRVLKLVKSNF